MSTHDSFMLLTITEHLSCSKHSTRCRGQAGRGWAGPPCSLSSSPSWCASFSPVSRWSWISKTSPPPLGVWRGRVLLSLEVPSFLEGRGPQRSQARASDKGSGVNQSPWPTPSSGTHVGSRWVKKSTGWESHTCVCVRHCSTLGLKLHTWAKLSPPPDFGSPIRAPEA